MAFDHYVNILNNAISVVVYSEGGIGWSDIENMYSDDFNYLIYRFKTEYENKQKSKQDFIKSIFEYANKFQENLFKLLQNLGKSRG